MFARAVVCVLFAACSRSEEERNQPDIEYLTNIDAGGGMSMVCQIHVERRDAGCAVFELEPSDGGNPWYRPLACGEAFTVCGIAGRCTCPWDATIVVPWRTGWRPWKNWP